MTTGVGIVGAGTVTQTVHLPTLTRLLELFAVRHVTDVDPAVANRIASRSGARASTEVAELLADPLVDVVAICSPPQLHAEQVIAACRAGKRVVLCEKPLASSVEEGRSIVDAAAESGTILIVGTMHLYEPVWLAAVGALEEVVPRVRIVRSSILLPPSDPFEAWSTEYQVAPRRAAPPTETAEQRAAVLRQRLLGVAIHDIPVLRRFLPSWDDAVVTGASLAGGKNFAVSLRAGDRVASLVGAERPYWDAEWELEAFGDDVHVHIRYTPSFVHAGSAVIRITADGETREWGPYDVNGYEQEWRHIADALADPDAHPTDYDALVDDLAFAIDLADQSKVLLAEGAAR